MTGADFLDLRQTGDPARFDLAVRARLCVGPAERMFLFGGAGLACGVAAAQAATGRPVVWAAAHYLSYAHPGDLLEWRVDEAARGNAVSQARVAARVGGREVLTVSAALGTRGRPEAGQWTRAPKAPLPADCPERPLWPHRDPDDLHAHLEVRVAQGRVGAARRGTPSEDGRSLLWVRPRHGVIDAAWACIIADFVPSGLGHALGLDAGGNSLDNTIRFHRPPDPANAPEWLLCDVQIHGVRDGFAHGRMHLFDPAGALVATASQSMIVRVWGE